jgi:hypothetical protein
MDRRVSMLKASMIKYILAAVAVICSGLIGYHFGFKASKKQQIENDLTYHLLSNLAVYQALQNASPGMAEDSLKVYIEGDLKTYDFYRSESPDFGNDNEHLQEFIKQARAVLAPK